MYDYLIIGAGLFGAIFAYKMNNHGKKCLVIEKRKNIAGNIYTESVDGIQVHKYGPHIFHTNNEKIWKFINKFADFNRFTNSPLAVVKGRYFNLPFNMNTFNQVWGIHDPEEAYLYIESQKKDKYYNPKNLEEKAISMVGEDLYKMFIKGYTEKQWGRECKELPASIIKRIPIRYNFDNNYYNDKFQGIPIGGYTQIIEKLLKDIEVKLNTDFFKNRNYFNSIAKKIVYTGPIDQFFNFESGKLDYRSLSFQHESLDMGNYQGNAIVNFCDKEIPYTRIIEHKKFEFEDLNHTIITKEFPAEYTPNNEPFYPINDQINNLKYQIYNESAKKLDNVIFGGRLAEYKYYDMHQVIASALKKADLEIYITT